MEVSRSISQNLATWPTIWPARLLKILWFFMVSRMTFSSKCFINNQNIPGDIHNQFQNITISTTHIQHLYTKIIFPNHCFMACQVAHHVLKYAGRVWTKKIPQPQPRLELSSTYHTKHHKVLIPYTAQFPKPLLHGPQSGPPGSWIYRYFMYKNLIQPMHFVNWLTQFLAPTLEEPLICNSDWLTNWLTPTDICSGWDLW